MSEQKDENGNYKYSSGDLIKFLGKNALVAYQSVLKGHTKPILGKAVLNERLAFQWQKSIAIGVEEPKYELFVYGKDEESHNYDLLVNTKDLTNLSVLIEIKELYNASRPYSNYKWFVRAKNDLGYTDSETSYFNVNDEFNKLIN